MKKIKTSLAVMVLTFTIGATGAFGQAAILAIIFGDKVASEEFNLSLVIHWEAPRIVAFFYAQFSGKFLLYTIGVFPIVLICQKA